MNRIVAYKGVSAALLLAGLSGCAHEVSSPTPTESPAHSSSPVSKPVDAPTYSLTADEEQACSGEGIVGRIAEARASTIEGPGNSLLAQPSEVKASGEDAVARQIEAWQALAPGDRIYQLCYAKSEAEP